MFYIVFPFSTHSDTETSPGDGGDVPGAVQDPQSFWHQFLFFSVWDLFYHVFI